MTSRAEAALPRTAGRRASGAARAAAFLGVTTAMAAGWSLGCAHEKKDPDPSAASASASAALTAPPPDESGKVSLGLSHAPLDPKNAPKISPSAPRHMAPVLPDEPGDCKSDNDCGLKDGEAQICCIQQGDNHKGPALGCQSKKQVCWKPCITDSDCPVKQQCKVVPGAGLLGCGF